MVLRDKIKFGVFAWVLAEVAALAILVRTIGWSSTLLIGLLTTFAGFYVLRQAGRDSLAFVRRSLQQSPIAFIEAPTSALLRVVSGLLLLLPGLISDLVGMVLLAPQTRALIVRRFSPAAPSARDGVVDLEPEEWRSARPDAAGAPCEPLPGVLPGGPKSAAAIRRPDDE